MNYAFVTVRLPAEPVFLHTISQYTTQSIPFFNVQLLQLLPQEPMSELCSIQAPNRFSTCRLACLFAAVLLVNKKCRQRFYTTPRISRSSLSSSRYSKLDANLKSPFDQENKYTFLLKLFENMWSEELRGVSFWKALTAEFIGTGLLVFIGCGAVVTSNSTQGTDSFVTPCRPYLRFDRGHHGLVFGGT